MTDSDRLILVVDDQPGVRRLVQEVFNEVGYRVIPAANGQEALALCRTHRPVLALLDMKMPVMDGMEALQLMRALHPEIIVVMMTAVGDGDRIEEAIAAGARTCISKPFDVFVFRELVEKVLREEGRV